MKKGKILGILAVSAVMLTGCIDSLPEMTAEQSDMVAEYAAGLVLKYSPNYDYKIVSDKELEAALNAKLEAEAAAETELNSETETQADSETEENAAEEKTKVSQENAGNQESEAVQIDGGDSDKDIALELGIDEVILKYQSFEICSSYPKDNAGFSLTAAQGKKLLVVHFDIESADGKEADCNLCDYSLKVRIGINGETSYNALDTLLANDVSSYIDKIGAGEKADVVSVAEIKDMQESDIESLSLQISSSGGSSAIKLK